MWNVQNMEQPEHYLAGKGLVAAPFLLRSQRGFNIGPLWQTPSKMTIPPWKPQEKNHAVGAEASICPCLVLSQFLRRGSCLDQTSCQCSHRRPGSPAPVSRCYQTCEESLMHFMTWLWCGVEDMKNTIIFFNAKDVGLVVVQKRINIVI